MASSGYLSRGDAAGEAVHAMPELGRLYVNRQTGQERWEPPAVPGHPQPHAAGHPLRAPSSTAERRELAVAQARVRDVERQQLREARERERHARQAEARRSPVRSPSRASQPQGVSSARTSACAAATHGAPDTYADAADAEAIARGEERGAAFLRWLRAEVDSRPVPPLEAFRLDFALGPEALRAAAKAEADEAAQVSARVRASFGSAADGADGAGAKPRALGLSPSSSATLAAAAERQRVLSARLAAPPAELSELQERVWRAFCEADEEGGGGLTRPQMETALQALGLGGRSAAEAATRWRQAPRQLATGRVGWEAFEALVGQLRRKADADKRREAAAQAAAVAAAERAAAERIQSRTRGALTRRGIRRQQAQQRHRAREASTRRRAAEAYHSGSSDLPQHDDGRCYAGGYHERLAIGAAELRHGGGGSGEGEGGGSGGYGDSPFYPRPHTTSAEAVASSPPPYAAAHAAATHAAAAQAAAASARVTAAARGGPPGSHAGGYAPSSLSAPPPPSTSRSSTGTAAPYYGGAPPPPPSSRPSSSAALSRHQPSSWPVLPEEPPPLSPTRVAFAAAAAERAAQSERRAERRTFEEEASKQREEVAALRASTAELQAQLDQEKCARAVARSVAS